MFKTDLVVVFFVLLLLFFGLQYFILISDEEYQFLILDEKISKVAPKKWKTGPGEVCECSVHFILHFLYPMHLSFFFSLFFVVVYFVMEAFMSVMITFNDLKYLIIKNLCTCTLTQESNVRQF